jgi:hypothetical protein
VHDGTCVALTDGEIEVVDQSCRTNEQVTPQGVNNVSPKLIVVTT